MGGADFGGGQHAWVYSGGMMQDLNGLIDPGSGWLLTYAAAINDNGQIAAEGCRAGQCQSLLLTLAGQDVDVPEPEPISAMLAALGLVGIARHKRRARQMRS